MFDTIFMYLYLLLYKPYDCFYFGNRMSANDKILHSDNNSLMLPFVSVIINLITNGELYLFCFLNSPLPCYQICLAILNRIN